MEPGERALEGIAALVDDVLATERLREGEQDGWRGRGLVRGVERAHRFGERADPVRLGPGVEELAGLRGIVGEGRGGERQAGECERSADERAAEEAPHVDADRRASHRAAPIRTFTRPSATPTTMSATPSPVTSPEASDLTVPGRPTPETGTRS